MWDIRRKSAARGDLSAGNHERAGRLLTVDLFLAGAWVPITIPGYSFPLSTDWRRRMPINEWHDFRAYDPARLQYVEGRCQWLTLPATAERAAPVDIYVSGPDDDALPHWISRQLHVAIRDTIRFGAASLSIAMPQPPRRRALPSMLPPAKRAAGRVLPFERRAVA